MTRKYACGCNETLTKRPEETPYQFRNRRFVNREHFNFDRKAKGWWKDKSKLIGKRSADAMKVIICKKCNLPKLNIHRDGFGIVEPDRFCIHGLKWDKQRRAYV